MGDLKPLDTLREESAALPAEVLADALREYGERRLAMLAWVQNQLIEGTHYGYPPGTRRSNADEKQWKQKPALYKAGAELCMDLFGVRAEFETDDAIWSQLGGDPGVICLKCSLVSRKTGNAIGEGRGIFRVGDKKMDANSSVKMAEKRAKVDAVLNTFNLSECWSQDLEEPSSVVHPAAKEAATAQSRGDRVTPENLTALYRTWADKTAIPADATQADKSAAFFADCSEFAGTALTSDANLWTQAHLQSVINGIVSRAAREATK